MRKRMVVSAALPAALVGMLLLGSCSASKAEGPGKTADPEAAGKAVVAQVNGVPVYASDLNLGITRLEQKQTAGGQKQESQSEEELREAALQVLIENELLFQEAQRRGFTAIQEAVEEELTAIAGQFPGPATFEKALAQMNVTKEDLRRDLERAQSVERMIESTIEPAVSVSAEEARAYFDANPRLFTDPERVHARQVFLRVRPDTTEEQKAEMRRTLEGLRERALRGESFAALADEFTQDPTSGKGGDLGYLVRGQLSRDFEEAVFALQPGQISGVINSMYGYHLVQAVDRQPATLMSFDKVRDSLTGFLRRRKTEQAVTALAQELRGKAKISVAKGRK